MGKKYNLEPSPGDYRSGYINVSSNPQINENLPENTVVIPGNISQLDHIIFEPASEIIFGLPINCIDPYSLPKLLGYWKSKLANNGILKVNYYDIKKIAVGINNESLGLQEIHAVVLGPNYQFKSIMDTTTVRLIMKEIGFFVDSISIVDYLVNMELVNKID